MSTIEDFRNAPVGATATHKATGNRAMKIDDVEQRWIRTNGLYMNDEQLERWEFTLDLPAPVSAREALDLAWELAHHVKEGQHIPEGTRLLDRRSHSHFSAYMTRVDLTINEWEPQTIRTLEPLPDPEPDWLDAPAVLARRDEGDHDEREVFTPAHEADGHWVAMFSALSYHWSELEDVTPLYPKGQDS